LATARRWLSSETELARYPCQHLPAADIDALTDEDSDRNWSANADIWDAGYDECGDDNRKYYSDPVLLAFLAMSLAGVCSTRGAVEAISRAC